MWIDADVLPKPYEVVLLQMLSNDYTTGWWAPRANKGAGAWIGLAFNQSPPTYQIESGFVKKWLPIPTE